jgi:tetratricopeptide (TPR) repeat protein
MKRIAWLIFTMLAYQIYACENKTAYAQEPEAWFYHWIFGMNLFQDKSYDEAVTEFSQAINLLEFVGQMDENHLHLYNDRGQALLLSKKYTQAIPDFTRVLETSNSPINQTIRALWGRTTCYGAINDNENFKKDYERLKVTDPDYPKVEYTKDYVIFKNFNTSALTPYAKDKFCSAMIHFDLCKSKEDIVFTNLGVCLVKRTCLYDSEKLKQDHQYEQNNDQSFGCCGGTNRMPAMLVAAGNIGDCKYWCDRVSQSAFVMCGSVFKTLSCKLICSGFVETLKEGCYWCCEGDGFYKKCVKPFEEFILQVPCDPQFD